MNHLNEDKLIQVAFDLLDADERQAAQQHLDECGDCRAALKHLQAKFAAMDTLAEEVPPSEELIAQTITHSKQKPEAAAPGLRHPVANALHRVIASCRSRSTLLSQPNIPLYRRRWVEWSAAAAAVALVCFLFLQNLPDTRVKEPKQIAESSPPVKGRYRVAERGSFPDDRMAALSSAVQDNHPGLTATPPSKAGELSKALPLPRGSTPKGGGGFSDVVNGVRIVSADAIPDKPPFAPASAIELVVLPAPDKTQVTIYNSADLTLVRDTRKLTLKPGWNWLQFMWDGTLIDPTSLSLTPLEYADKIDIQQLVYPARLKDIGRWLIRSEVEGAVPFEITYFASGLSWRAFYMGTMNEDETTMDLKGYVNVSNNSGQDFENTQTRLIVGQTRLTEEIRTLAQRRYPYGPDIPTPKEISYPKNWKDISNTRVEGLRGNMSGMGGAVFNGNLYFGLEAGVKYDIKQIEKTGLSEYFLYTIEGTEDLTNQWTRRLPSFDVNDIPVKSLYKYDEDRYGKEPVRFVSFKNDAEHELGETPIPEGSIKIYRNVNEQQNLSYVGQSDIKYIPVNEDIELNLGPARLVKVEPVLMEKRTENYTFDPNNNITGWDDIETYKVTIINTRDIPVDIEITWNMGTDAWELELNPSGLSATSPSQGRSSVESSPPAKGEYPEGGRGFDAADTVVYKKHDKNRARFTMTVPARSEKDFGITIRKYRQKRIEAYIQKMQEQEK
jgi:hypothetical protein